MQLKYNLNDKPPVIHTLLYGLQWLVIAIPNVVTIGMLAKLQFGDDIQMQTSYLQSVYFVLGLTMLVQAFWGHRLPLVVGPAAVLIVGILSASASSSFNAIYTAVAIGGATLLLLSVSGLLGKVARIFTPRVIVVILGLIAMTLAPVIISLLFGEGHDLFSFAFFLVGLIATFALERFLRGVGKSLTVMIVTVAGSFVYFLFNGMPEVQSAGYTTDIDKLDIIPSHIDLVGAEIEMLNLDNREKVIKGILDPLRPEYDFIIIDCSPSLGLITVNSLTAADSVIIPVQCEYFALEGISKLLNTIKIIKSRLNPKLEIEGFLLTMFDSRLRLANQIYDEVKRHFQELVFKAIIRRNVKLSEAPSHGLPAILYDADSQGAKDHLMLAKEIIEKSGYKAPEEE